jgi:hypothetical protein
MSPVLVVIPTCRHREGIYGLSATATPGCLCRVYQEFFALTTRNPMRYLEPQKGGSMRQLIALRWEESERGWGVRPDGISFHKNLESAKIFVERYWDRLPDGVPDEYSRPSGEPFVIEVSEWIYRKVQNDGDWWSNINSPAVAATYLGDRLSDII